MAKILDSILDAVGSTPMVRLRKIGRQARVQIEELLGVGVYLDLWVKIRPDWRNKDRDLKDFGYL